MHLHLQRYEKMLELNLPKYDFKLKKSEKGLKIFDAWRCRWVTLTPEEWVRQHFLHFMEDHLGYPHGLMAVETAINVNGTSKRCDAVVYGRDMKPLVLVEFKRPDVVLTQKVFDQVAVYNTQLGVRYFLISNGLQHYACAVDAASGRYCFFQTLPTFSVLSAPDSPVPPSK